ncbi:MAG: ABC transporter permease subunit [Streptosporangiales bacterium]|nr:ABC transporter permease subunit [Streptosporangiales bacterium]
MADRRGQRPLRFGDAAPGGPVYPGADRPLHRDGRADRVRARLPTRTVRRHAAAGRAGPRPRHRAPHPAHGRAAGGRGRDDPGTDAGRAVQDRGRDRAGGAVHHAQRGRGHHARRPHRRGDEPAGPHQGDNPGAVPATPRPGCPEPPRLHRAPRPDLVAARSRAAHQPVPGGGGCVGVATSSSIPADLEVGARGTKKAWWRAVVARLPGLAAFAGLILAWQLVVVIGDIEPLLLPGPAAVAGEAAEVWEVGLLQGAFLDTISALGVGLALGIAAGIVLGLVIGALPRADVAATPYLWGLFSTPDIALVPIVILWFGFGTTTKVGMVFLAVTIPLALICKDGVRTVDESMRRAAAAFCASRRDMFLKVIVPATLPSIATGIRNGMSRGFVGVLVVEMTVGTTGLGREVMYAMRQYNTARMFVFIWVLVFLAVVLITVTKRLESYASRWREEVDL